MYRDGLGVAQDTRKAVGYFQTAANYELPDALVNLGKLYLSVGETNQAMQYFDHANRNGDAFQSFYYLAEYNAHVAPHAPDFCPVAVAFYKIVAERGDWEHEVWWDAQRAWARGDKDRALLGYWMMAERGYEAAQNNIAWMLDRGKIRERFAQGECVKMRMLTLLAFIRQVLARNGAWTEAGGPSEPDRSPRARVLDSLSCAGQCRFSSQEYA
jgi:TPR repeat protein